MSDHSRSPDSQRMSDLHLHLLLWRAVAVANDGDDAAQLHPGGSRGGGSTSDLVQLNLDANSGSRTYMDPEVVGTMGMSSASMGMDQGMWNWGANSLITMFLGSEARELDWNGSTGGPGAQLHLPQNFGTVVIVLHGVLHKAETVDVTNVGVAVGPQQVEAAHGLLATARRR